MSTLAFKACLQNANFLTVPRIAKYIFDNHFRAALCFMFPEIYSWVLVLKNKVTFCPKSVMQSQFLSSLLVN